MRWLLVPLVALCGAAMAWESPQGDPWGSVYFETDSDEVLGYEFPQVPEADSVRIVGHADRRWTPAHNLGLSERRAKAVAHAIGRTDAKIVAKGDTAPVTDCPTDDADCLLEDRRVDIFLDCRLTHMACTASPPQSWMADEEPVRMVTDRSRF